MQIPDLMMTLAEALTGSTATAAAADPGLLATWSAAAPESRAAILLSYAWGTRGKPHILVGEHGHHSHALGYANDFHAYAGAAPEDTLAFHGRRFPMPHYPGPAGALAASVGFDRDEYAVSLETALILLATGHGTVTAP